MMQFKKIVSLLIVLLLTFSAFAGCGIKGEEKSEEVSTKVSFPLKDELNMKFTMAGIANMKDPNLLKVFQDMQKETNIKITWEVVTSGWDEKKSLMFAGGQLPDVIFGAKAITNTEIANNSSFFEPLEEYIEKYCQNIKKMFKESPELKKNTTAADGHIYSIPQRLPLRPYTRNIQYISKKWLDKLNLGIPKSTEEFYNVLKAFKENDPNGNNKKDEIPFIFDGIKPANGFVSILGAFGISENTTGDWIMVENGKVKFAFTDDRMIDGVKYLNKLYKEGLIDGEVFTQAAAQMNAKIRNPEIAIVGSGYTWTIESAMNNAERAAEYVALPPLKGPKGDQLWRPSTVMSGDSAAFVMSKNNNNKEATMKWIDKFYDPKLGIQLYFGPLGDCLELDSNNKYTILPPKDTKMTADAWMWANGLNDRSPIYVNAEFCNNVNWNSWVSEKLSVDKIYKSYAEKVEEFPPFLNYSKSDVSEITPIKAEAIKFANQKIVEWIVNGKIDEEWESYKKQLDSIGLPRMIKIMQKAYDVYKK